MFAQVRGRRTEDMPLAAQVAMPQRSGPHVGTAYAHDDIDALLDRVDEAVGKRNVRQQQGVILGEPQNDWQCLQAAESRR